MGIAILAFVAIFLLIGSAGVMLFYREQMVQRLTAVISPESKQKTLMETIQQSGFSLSGVVEHLERVIPKSQAEVFMIYVTAMGLGFLAPDFWLSRQIKKRQAKLRRGLPDVLDLLVICIEAGLSLDQATRRTTEELVKAHPAICDELNIVVLEQRAGRARADCWRHLAERTDVDSLRNLVSVLVQSEQFGTSIAKTLRVHSDTLRTQRMQKVEEMAAKTTVKLVFPLVLFIFPSLFLVVLGPAMITMSESFKGLLNR